MRRIDTLNRATDLFGSGKHGWKNGIPGTGDRPTEGRAEWFNAIQEEFATFIEAAGIALNAGDSTQLRAAVNALFVSRARLADPSIGPGEIGYDEAHPYPVDSSGHVLRRLHTAMSNDAAAFDAYGDSITFGAAGTSSVNAAYVNLLSNRRQWTVTNHAVNGSMVADQADAVYAKAVGNAQQSTLALGTNDFRFYKEDVHKMLAFERGHMALAAWLAIPDANKLKGQVASSNLAYTGTWANAGTYGGALSKQTVTPGSTVSAFVYGTVAYLATTVVDGGTCTFDVSVDGTSIGTFTNGCAGGNVTSINGRTYMPQLLRLPGLNEDTHEVKITVLTVGAGAVYFDWAAGNLGNSTRTGPNVWVGNIPRLATAGYATYGGTDNGTVALYNAMIRNSVSVLSHDGLNVALVDVQSRFDNQSMLAGDGIHPNDAGHEVLAQAWQESLNQVSKLRRVRDVAAVVNPVDLRNLLLNASFYINQRGVTGSVVLAANAYGHDMWKAGAAGCTYSFSTVGNTTIINITAGSLVQIVPAETVRQESHVLSWRGTAKGRVLGGTYAPSPVRLDAAVATALGLEWGVGTLTQPQLERGGNPSAYAAIPYTLDQDMCQQYLAGFAVAAGKKLGVGQCISTTQAIIFIPFKRPLRFLPTGISSSGTFSVTSATHVAISATVAFQSASFDGVTVLATAASGLTAGNATSLEGAGVANIVVTGSEL